jgi:hypothetical protein
MVTMNKPEPERGRLSSRNTWIFIVVMAVGIVLVVLQRLGLLK